MGSGGILHGSEGILVGSGAILVPKLLPKLSKLPDCLKLPPKLPKLPKLPNGQNWLDSAAFWQDLTAF